MSGGELVARVLERWGVAHLFTLCGGHISPILVEAKKRGIRILDVRHEATAVFAADAAARLTGVPGVAAVTAGPGVTNTITALKNAQMAQSPVVLLGGATPTVLKGRGSLQDIEQLRLVRSLVKGMWSVGKVRNLAPVLHEAFQLATSGVPGPVFVECPVDLLYEEEVIRGWYAAKTEGKARGLLDAAQKAYLRWHLDRLFAGADEVEPHPPSRQPVPAPDGSHVAWVADRLARARRPVLVLGSQSLVEAGRAEAVAAAVGKLGVPVYLAGMARGLLGREHPLQLRHGRKAALKAADCVILAGFPCDFRLDYGSPIPRGATFIAINRGRRDLTLNRRPDHGVLADPGLFLERLADGMEALPRGEAGEVEAWAEWLATLRRRDEARDGEILAQGGLELREEGPPRINPLTLFQTLEATLPEDSLLVADGGDFVATASYILRPRGPLRWLDPGVFGTLGVGGGFALGASVCRPGSEIWLLYGDGSAGYSLAEFDTFARHGLPVIAVVGNDAGWTQIAREQVEILGDDVGTVLARTDYHKVAEGYGGAGLLLDDPAETETVFARARELASEGRPVLINALLGKTDFRKGSISM